MVPEKKHFEKGQGSQEEREGSSADIVLYVFPFRSIYRGGQLQGSRAGDEGVVCDVTIQLSEKVRGTAEKYMLAMLVCEPL